MVVSRCVLHIFQLFMNKVVRVCRNRKFEGWNVKKKFTKDYTLTYDLITLCRATLVMVLCRVCGISLSQTKGQCSHKERQTCLASYHWGKQRFTLWLKARNTKIKVNTLRIYNPSIYGAQNLLHYVSLLFITLLHRLEVGSLSHCRPLISPFFEWVHLSTWDSCILMLVLLHVWCWLVCGDCCS